MDHGADIINFDYENPMQFIKKEIGGKGAICIDVVGLESVGHMSGNTLEIDGNDIKIHGSDEINNAK